MKVKNTVTGKVMEIADAVLASMPTERRAKYVETTEPLKVYTRADYKKALDKMILVQCNSYEFDGVQTLANWLTEPNDFYDKARWCVRLNLFTWTTSNYLAANPPAGDPPTPDQFAATILAMFEANNPRPAA